MVEAKDLPCEKSANGCQKLRHDHVTYYMHSKERIGIELGILSDDLSPPLESSPNQSFQPRISNWTICLECQAKTIPRVLSAAALQFSFSKYCELLLYDSEFVPLPEVCPHSDAKQNLKRYFSVDQTTVSFKVEKIE